MAVDSHNDVWVADYESDRVEEYNEKGEYVRQFGSKGSGQGQFKEPKGIAISPAGNVLVIDTGNERVQTSPRPANTSTSSARRAPAPAK